MSRAATLTTDEAQHKARAEHYLAETQKILRGLAAERERHARRSSPHFSLVDQVKAILRGR